MKKNAVILLIEAFRGLPVMNEIMNILEKKEFTGSASTKEIGETVIGVMSPLTRAMYSFLETAGKEDFEKAKLGFILEEPFDCLGPKLSCLQNVVFEMDICPYAKALQRFKEEHPMLAHVDFVKKFMHALISNQIPEGEKIIEGFYLVTTENLDFQSPDFTKYDGWENMNLEQLMEVSIKETFLAPIAEILESGQFKDEEESALRHEVVIRDMTSLEKAIFTRSNLCAQNVNQFIDEQNLLLKGENFAPYMISIESLFFPTSNFISMSMLDGESESFIPKDKSNPDFLRVQEIQKELDLLCPEINHLTDLMWEIIEMGLGDTINQQYNSLRIRAGFQIVLSNI